MLTAEVPVPNKTKLRSENAEHVGGFQRELMYKCQHGIKDIRMHRVGKDNMRKEGEFVRHIRRGWRTLACGRIAAPSPAAAAHPATEHPPTAPHDPSRGDRRTLCPAMVRLSRLARLKGQIEKASLLC